MQVSAESGHRVEWVVEKNYKFKLGAAADVLAAWLHSGAGMRRRRAMAVTWRPSHP
jgi:hypothetical protein